MFWNFFCQRKENSESLVEYADKEEKLALFTSIFSIGDGQHHKFDLRDSCVLQCKGDIVMKIIVSNQTRALPRLFVIFFCRILKKWKESQKKDFE